MIRDLASSRVLKGQIVYSAVTLGIIDHLDTEGESSEEVAEELGLNPQRTHRLLRALTEFDVVGQNNETHFFITSQGKRLQKDNSDSIRDSLLLYNSPEFLSAIQHLPDIIENGGPDGFTREFGSGFFEYTKENPEFNSIFNEAMTVGSKRTTPYVLDTLSRYDFSGISTVCDVGGGKGYFMSTLLSKYSHLKGIVFDRPEVVGDKDGLVAPEDGTGDRCTYIQGDMFKQVPRADVYFLKHVLNDWDDDECIDILSTIHSSSSKNAKVLLCEYVLTDSGEKTSKKARWIDILTMCMMGGRTRTVHEYGDILNEAGWEVIQEWNSPTSPISVVEGAK